MFPRYIARETIIRERNETRIQLQNMLVVSGEGKAQHNNTTSVQGIGLSAVNAIGTQLRDPINSGLTRWRMAVSYGRRRGTREQSRK